ncbi:MAG: hypothetical protein JNM14_04205 [Ferruginibacter sp.]|nr:hypothetical protein [Ferruginibacter sp.]
MKCFFYTLIFLFAFIDTEAQSVAINTTGATANTSAILDVSSNSKGVLVPRMTKGQKNAITTPAIALLVYQFAPDSIGFHYYNGSAWIWLNPSGSGGNDWSLTGNTGTDTATNFIGTTDAMPIRFKQGNEWIGQFNKNTGNYLIGEVAGKKITSGVDNIGIGDSALNSITVGSRNTAIGSLAFTKSLNGTDNTAVGYNSLNAGTIAFFNTSIGARALELNTTGDNNVAVGAQAMSANTTGGLNTAIGTLANAGNTNGSANVAVGNQAMQFNTSGFYNTAVGNAALFNNTTGYENVALGALSLWANQTGNNNIAIGDNVMVENLTGNHNIAIGDSSVIHNISSSNLIGIGRRALYNVTASSNLIGIGDSVLYSNTSAIKNIALGNKALLNTTTGSQNVAIGYNTLKNNVTGFANIAIGDSALPVSTTNWNIAIGRYALLETITGDKNIAIGDVALRSNVSGGANVAIGYASQADANTNNRNNTTLGFRTGVSMQGYSNTAIGGDAMGKPATSYTVNNNVAVGDSVLFNIATGANSNTALGTKTLFSNTTGRSNTAIGARALNDNTAGNFNVAIGDSAAFNNNATGSVAIGSKAMFSNVVGTNTAIGYEAMKNSVDATGQNTVVGTRAFNTATIGQQNTVVGYEALSQATIASVQATALGNWALKNRNAAQTVAIGSWAGMKSSAPVNLVQNNIYMGFAAGVNSTTDSSIYFGGYTGENNTGGHNMFIGHESGRNSSGEYNTVIGERAGYFSSSVNNNTMIGYRAGELSSGNNNVYLGQLAGYNNSLSNKLFIDNSGTSSPLIYGDFATNLLRVNGTLDINNVYQFPISDGAANQVLRTNGGGIVSWASVNGESTTANNGLTLTGSNVALGGTLLANTTITHGNFNLTHSLSGTGDFIVSTPTRPNAFTVLSGGDVSVNGNDFVVNAASNVGINTLIPNYKLHLVNTTGGLSNLSHGIMIQNTNAATTGQATLAFKNAGPDGLPASRAWITGMSDADNYAIAYGDSLVGTATILRVDTAGYVGIYPSGPPLSRLDVVGSVGNAIRVTTVSTTLDVDDHTLIIGPAAGSISITLPAAGTVDRREYVIVNRSASNQSVTSYNDFSGTSVLVTANSAITLQSNGVNWFRIR